MSEPLTEVFQIRLSIRHAVQLKAAAERAGVSQAEFLRQAIIAASTATPATRASAAAAAGGGAGADCAGCGSPLPLRRRAAGLSLCVKCQTS